MVYIIKGCVRHTIKGSLVEYTIKGEGCLVEYEVGSLMEYTIHY